jgi:hypothetical protein
MINGACSLNRCSLKISTFGVNAAIDGLAINLNPAVTLPL